jgi:copper chaperone CopZ
MAINTINLKVVGERTMHCDGCANTVKLALKRLPGVLQVDASHETQVVDVTLNAGQSDATAIKDTLAQLGYEAAEVESPQN